MTRLSQLPKKNLCRRKKLKRLLLRILMDSIRPDIGFPEQPWWKAVFLMMLYKPSCGGINPFRSGA
jgi:hypothetical protein